MNATPTVKTLSILVVDDAAEVREVIALALTSVHHAVTAVPGKNAVALLQSRHFDVVLTDVVGPGPASDGLALVYAAQRFQPQARIVAMSGGTMELDAEDCLERAQTLSGGPVLRKPFSADALLRAIEN